MNRASDEANSLEVQHGEAEARFHRKLKALGRLQEDLQRTRGVAMQRALPFYEASRALRAASARVHAVADTFAAAASEQAEARTALKVVEAAARQGCGVQVARDVGERLESFALATARVLEAQIRCGTYEADYAAALRHLEAARVVAKLRREQAGADALRLGGPCLWQLRRARDRLSLERGRMEGLAARAREAKEGYRGAMRELEQISEAVHAERQLRWMARAAPVEGVAAELAPEETHPAPAPAEEVALNLGSLWSKDGCVEVNPFA